jgi:hypothetical protein
MDGFRKKIENALNLHPTTNMYDKVFVYLLIASIVLRLIWLDMPKGSLIFDER